jgi:MFS family permease
LRRQSLEIGANSMKHFYGWRVVAACLVVNMFGNALGLFGVGVYLKALSEAHGWPVGQISAGITIFLLVSAALMLPVGRTISRHGPKPVVFLGAISMAAGVLGIGYARTITQVWLAFAVLGVGWASLSATAIAAMIAPWFEKHQGRAVSLAALGASMGGIVGVPVLLFAIADVGLSSTTVSAAIAIIAVLFPIAIFVMERSPQELGLLPDGAPAASAKGREAAAWTVSAAARSPALWTVTVAFSIGMFVQVGFLTHQVTLLSTELSPALISATASATAIVALVGRLGLASFVDRIDQRAFAAAVLLLAAATFCVLGCFPTKWVLIAGSVVFGLTMSNVTILSAIIVRREFGAVSFGTVFGFASSIIQFATALGPSFYGVLRETSSSYQLPLLVAAALDVVAAAVVWSGSSLATKRSSRLSYPPSAPQ